MKIKLVLLGSLCLLILLVVGCAEMFIQQKAILASQNGPVSDGTIPKGDRVLSLDINEVGDISYDETFEETKRTGFEVVTLSLFWDELETSPGEFNPETNYLAIANAYYPSKNTPIVLAINPFDTGIDRRPLDLQDKAIDDPEVLERFDLLLDYVFSQIPDLELYSLAIGNEIDVGRNPDDFFFAQYQVFLRKAAGKARVLRKGVDVGTKATFKGLTQTHVEPLRGVNQYSDVVMVTYYPFSKENFSGIRVKEDFALLNQTYLRKPIHIAEAGFPSSDHIGSSSTAQEIFVRELFYAWDLYPERIPFVNIVRLHDYGYGTTQDWVDYYGSDDRFLFEFIQTLGLRKADGIPKSAYTTLVNEARARGFES